MDFYSFFGTTLRAIIELVLLGGVGFFLLRRRIISEEGLFTLSHLVVNLFLPLFMFTQIVTRFSFSAYPQWWIFPLLSVAISGVGYVFGLMAIKFDKIQVKYPQEFLGITSFQNSGYLPLPLVAALLGPQEAATMFIYIFLFLLGFNMTIFSFGMYLLAPTSTRRFDIKGVINPPVVATLTALVLVLVGVNRFVPPAILRPAEMLGHCTIPLSMLVVGGNLGMMKITGMDKKPMIHALLIKLLVLPLFFLGVLIVWRPPTLVGLLVMLQAAMPPAALLSVVCRAQDCEDKLITPSIVWGHLAAIVTVPLCLGLYEYFAFMLF